MGISLRLVDYTGGPLSGFADSQQKRTFASVGFLLLLSHMFDLYLYEATLEFFSIRWSLVVWPTLVTFRFSCLSLFGARIIALHHYK